MFVFLQLKIKDLFIRNGSSVLAISQGEFTFTSRFIIILSFPPMSRLKHLKSVSITVTGWEDVDDLQNFTHCKIRMVIGIYAHQHLQLFQKAGIWPYDLETKTMNHLSSPIDCSSKVNLN